MEKRRRGRRRDRSGNQQTDGFTPAQQGEPPRIQEESQAPGVLPSRLTFWRGRGSREKGEKRDQPKTQDKKAASTSTPGETSPLEFWRQRRARSHREQPLPRQGPQRFWARITGLYFPPWVPVLAVILVVFAILGGLFFARGATGAPRIGDHWHAPYQMLICGKRQPNIPEVEPEGVGTHADGVIHLHPFTPAGEGSGARLVTMFDRMGGKLGKTEIRIPYAKKTFKNGDTCDDGTEGVLQVFVNGEPLESLNRYIPQDGDRIRIVFGPEGAEQPITSTVQLEVTDDGTEAGTRFSPASIEVNAGETVKLVVRNTGSLSHSVRMAGADGRYGTGDDYVSNPEKIEPGAEATIVVIFEKPGRVDFSDPTAGGASGTIVVKDVTPAPEPSPQASPTSNPTPQPASTTLDVVMGDSFFQPNQLTVKASERFRINLVNEGRFVHNLRISGPDREYDTDDDLVSEPDFQKGGESGELVGRIDAPGVYPFRCDFHPTVQTGTITVR